MALPRHGQHVVRARQHRRPSPSPSPSSSPSSTSCSRSLSLWVLVPRGACSGAGDVRAHHLAAGARGSRRDARPYRYSRGSGSGRAESSVPRKVRRGARRSVVTAAKRADGESGGSSSGRMSVQEACELLGILEDETDFNVIVEKKNRLLLDRRRSQRVLSDLDAEADGDTSGDNADVEEAYDVLLMRSLTLRNAGAVSDPSVRYADVRKRSADAGSDEKAGVMGSMIEGGGTTAIKGIRDVAGRFPFRVGMNRISGNDSVRRRLERSRVPAWISNFRHIKFALRATHDFDSARLGTHIQTHDDDVIARLRQLRRSVAFASILSLALLDGLFTSSSMSSELTYNSVPGAQLAFAIALSTYFVSTNNNNGSSSFSTRTRLIPAFFVCLAVLLVGCGAGEIMEHLMVQLGGIGSVGVRSPIENPATFPAAAGIAALWLASLVVY